MIILPGSSCALGRSTGGLALAIALMSACKSGEVSPQKERRVETASTKAAETAASPGAPVLVPEGTSQQLTVQASKQGVVLADKSGKETVRVDTTSGKAPEDWPSEVPLYPGGKVQMSMQLGRGATLTLTTPDSIAKVIEYYEMQLARMPQSKAVEAGKNQTRLWSDPSKPLQVTLALSEDRGLTKVTLIVTRERAR
jgi:hypothetical protein